jgi:hypothetical protein
MARSRNIKPGFFANEHLAMLPYEIRLLFIGLWTLADREGRLEDRPTRIKMQLFGADTIDVVACLDQLADAGEPFIRRYVVDDVPLIQIVNFSKHQRPHKNEPAIHPAPVESDQDRSASDQNPIDSGQYPTQSLQNAKRSIQESVRGNQQTVIQQTGIRDQESANGNQAEGNRGFVDSSASKNGSNNRVSKNAARSYPKDFLAWWSHYPNKIGKPSAHKQFAPALSRIAAERSLTTDEALAWLIDRTKGYARAVADKSPQHIKHPGPWLSDDRFNDEPPASSSLKVVSAGTRYQRDAEGFGHGF